MNKGGWLYILTNRPNGTLYTGVTGDLTRRLHEHRSGTVEGFTKTYALHRLVYFERHETILDAITREKQIKNWHRAYKTRLIMSTNPNWTDLYDTLF